MNILIVDDEPLEREVLTLMIKREDLKVNELFMAENGIDAVEQMRQKQMDVIIMDIKMPIMNGIRAAEIIKKDIPECPIIFLTAYDELDVASQTLNLGVVEDLLLKPAHPYDIRKVLQKYIPVANRPNPCSDCCDHVVTVIEFIEDNLHSELNLDILSELVFLSGQYLSRLFKQETSCTITQYITIRRIDRAKKYLRGRKEATITEISQECGFADSNYFTRVFKKYEGVTPKQYQQQSFIPRKKRMNSFNNFVM